MKEQLFESAMASLNSAQREAVMTTEGPVMVVAGPGTGKTQMLTLRIANILAATDTAPENILALTFTEAGARAMRERLIAYIGKEAYRVPIHTFHNFAEMLIRSYPDAYERVIGGRAASDLKKIELILGILEDPAIRHIRPIGDPSFYVPHILRSIGILKQEYITPDGFRVLIGAQEKELALTPKIHEKGAHKGKVRSEFQKKERSLERNRELLFVYLAYEALLKAEHLYDFDDMILETVKALENNTDMLLDLQESYHYILADEHQDVNGSQNRILELLASYHNEPNLFVVGDEKQAIYRFQGASLENFLYFEDLFPKTKTIALTSNYRSGQKILDAAHDLITSADGPAQALRVALTSETKSAAQVEVRSFSHEAIEDVWIKDTIQALVDDGTPPEEIAVILRTNREVEECAERLRRSGIPASASADGDILSHPITGAIRTLIDAVTHIESEAALFGSLHLPCWNISQNDMVRIASARGFKLRLPQILESEKILHDLGVEDVTKVRHMLSVIKAARKRESTAAPHRILELLLVESGFLEEVMANDSLEGARVIRRIYDEIEEMVKENHRITLRDVGDMFATCIAHKIPLNAPFINTTERSVRVMTAHKSKGLEFLHVFVAHLNDSLWGGRKHSEYFSIPITKHLKGDAFDALDDERRLLYVAMTRAKEGLYMSYSGKNAKGRELLPSRLLEEIGSALIERSGTANEEGTFNPIGSFTGSEYPTIDPMLLRSLLLERGLSATALNNYLRSPWDYFYRNTLRIPEVEDTHLLFGTALHGVLERVTSYHSEHGTMPTDSEAKRYLEQNLGKLPLTDHEYVRLHKRGLESLVAYLGHLRSILPKETKEEFRLRVMLPTDDPSLPEIPLTGMLDRLDFDEEGNVIRVIDYKSGKPKTRGYIEGKTKDSNGDYKRQLVFYALLLSLYGDPRYATREGVLSFVEPDGKGMIREESFVITDDELAALKEEIVRVAHEIAEGTFMSTPCDPSVSSYCGLVNVNLSRPSPLL